MLILAGVTILALSGDNGILNRSTQAKQNTQKGDASDRIKLLLTEWQTERYTGTKTMSEFLEEKFDNLVDNEGGTITAVTPGTVASNKITYTTNGTDADGKRWGKLYDFTSTGSNALNWTEVDGKISITGTIENETYREPDVVTGSGNSYDASSTYLSAMNTILGTNYTTSADFETDLETDSSNMITSVEKYKGFYVGRYETSLNATTKVAQSKQVETSADASQTDTYRWYGLYARQKLYSTDSVQGSMIWGSQYDAMMKWMQGNGIRVDLSTPIEGALKNTTRVTGGANSGQTVSKDKLSNVYDLLGNSYEWTIEAYNTYYRLFRGGSYDSSSAPQDRNYYNLGLTGSSYSSRLALCIE